VQFLVAILEPIGCAVLGSDSERAVLGSHSESLRNYGKIEHEKG